MTKKLWFQAGVGILLALLIVKYFLEIKSLFYPIVVILSAIFIPLLAGGILYYVTEPIQRFLEKKKFPRWASILSIIVLISVAVYGFIAIVVPPINTQINNLVKATPTLANELSDMVDYVLKNRENFPDQLNDAIDSVTNSIQDYAVFTSKFLVQFISSIVSGAFVLILVPFFFIYMLKDHEKFAPTIYNLFTGSRRAWIKKTLSEIDDVLRNYIQGQLLISFILAIIIFIGYKIIGLEYALLLALFAFFMNMVPFIGPWIALVPAIIVGLVHDPMQAVWVCVVTLVAQQIDSNFITPNVMGKTLDIHPLTVITIILAAGNIAGFVGILLGVPLYAVGKVVVKNVYQHWKAIRTTATKNV
ncbi:MULTISPECIES: AI-2E family transporter [Rummeliibacillus]|uniref:AI-2E family transporter n=1 Tax=Rummeliibacillus TaxID=648802 RepID=UPI0011B77EC5|nr:MULTISPECIES: AI-2E family transporter [Rummeliibacillus]MBO2536830.1 AI-2E family transporter [Rummeliibacillus suwonensis]